MNDNEEAKSAEASGQEQNDGIAFDLNFAPSWARTDPNANVKRYRDEDYAQNTGDREGGRDRRSFRRDADRDRGDSRRRDRRPPRRDSVHAPRREGSADMPRPESHGAVADLRPSGGMGGRRGADPRPPRQEYVPALPLDIRVLPEQKALGAVIRRIQTTHRAFPLRDIASLFLDNPASCLLRIEPQKGQQIPLFQCKVCGMPALSEEEIRAHLINCHMDDFFDVEDVKCDPPSGQFVCVARCGLSGVLLGPPNHHSFNSKVHEMLRTKYASMSEEAYRSHIEMVRDPETIEEWRNQCTVKKIYRRKGAAPTPAEPVPAEANVAAETSGDTAPVEEVAPKAPPMERDVAELVFLREILPAQILSARHVLCTVAVAMKTPSRPLFYPIKDVLNRERRYPVSLYFALRGAFRHRSLFLFRANESRGQDFVQLAKPQELNPEHAVQALRDVLAFINEHPGCTKQEMLQTLAGADAEKGKETLAQLAWLVEKGHVIHFFNDTLCGPIEYPAFHPKQTKGAAPAQGREVSSPARNPETAEVAPAQAPASPDAPVSGSETDPQLVAPAESIKPEEPKPAAE